MNRHERYAYHGGVRIHMSMKQIRAKMDDDVYRRWKIAKAELEAETNGDMIRLLIEQYESENDE
jgi:hypothetical protein